MIPGSNLVKLLSLGLAAGVVLGASQWLQPDNSAKIAGGGAPTAAQLGTRFEDMSAGTLTAQPVEENTPTPPAETTALKAEAPAPLAPAQPVEPLQPTQPVPTAAPKAEIIAAAPKAEVIVAAPPAVTASETPVLPPVTPQPAPTETASAPPSETLTAAPKDTPAPRLSRRPQRRDPVRAAEAAQKAKPKPAPTPKPKQTTRGNAKRNNTQGAQAATRAGNATQSGARKQAAAPSGNAAASNYPGQVMARIARAGKPRVRSRGTAVIAFSVGSSGQLARASVARSSGSSALDQAALALIRKAAPFPRPPAGAQRSFSIRIKGR